jgi:catechol 2,3-dioxygenase-like lactoylglutathione lyase family enzyme
MIRIEHLNLVVANMKETLAFYGAAFPHWFIRLQGEADWYGTTRTWLHFGDDYQFLTFNDNGTGENRDLKGNQVGLAHFAFVVSSLDALVNRLLEAGQVVHKEGARNMFRKNIYFLDPSGYEVEFVEYLSDLPAQRNNDEDGH